MGLLGHEKGYKATSVQLYSADFVPKELRRVYIIGGYRSCPLSIWGCLQSAVLPTNELLNVWTHVLGYLAFAHEALWGKSWAVSGLDRLVAGYYLAAAQFCMLMSTAFHLFGPASVRTYSRLHKADVAGILTVIHACYTLGVHVGLRCTPVWRGVYLAAATITTAAFATALMLAQGVPRRAVVWLTGMSALGLVPVAHWAIAIADSEERAEFGPRVASFFVLLILGVIFYLTAVPERWAPGSFDLLAHSHTLWHICVAVAVYRFYGSLAAYSDTSRANGRCGGDGLLVLD